MTTRKKHDKHPPLVRVTDGMYMQSEWAIYGTTCAKIADLVTGLSRLLAPGIAVVYIDADHSEEHKGTELQVGKKRWSTAKPLSWNTFDDKMINWAADIVLVNGNHYAASRQIVVIDDDKKDSLHRRVEQLTAIDVVLCDRREDIYDFIRPLMKTETIVLSASEIQQVAGYLKGAVEAATPTVKALVLAGGKSSRMLSDKATIAYHDGKPHEHYVAGLCQELGVDTFISKGHTFEKEDAYGVAVLKDRLIDMGPLGAIVTAFMHDPNAAWLVLACDLPLIDQGTIEHLITNRSRSAFATAYQIVAESFPEPLMTIYEPKIYQRLLRFMSLGYACPRKVLINSEVHLLPLADKMKAYNANTPEEREQALTYLKNL